MRDQHHTPIRQQIEDAIREGKASMKPRWHFLVMGALSVVGVLIVFTVVLYLINLGVLLMHDSGLLFIPAFGMLGVLHFLLSAPWAIFLFVVVFLTLLEVLVRKFSFAYRKPLLYSMLLVALVVGLGSSLLYAVVPNEILRKVAEHGGFMENGKPKRGVVFTPPQNVHPGTLREVNAEGFIITLSHGEERIIIVTSDTRYPEGTDFIVGDRVVVLGGFIATNTVEALGVKRIEDCCRTPRRERGWKKDFSATTSIQGELSPAY